MQSAAEIGRLRVRVEVGGCRPGAETRLTGIGSGGSPESADATSRGTGLPGPPGEVAFFFAMQPSAMAFRDHFHRKRGCSSLEAEWE